MVAAGSKTNEDLREYVEELKQRVAEARIAEGRPPEPPEPFVSLPLGIILVERLQSFLRIAAQYASVLAAGELVKVDTAKLGHFRETATLAEMCVGLQTRLVAGAVLHILDAMERINEAIDSGAQDEINKPFELRKLNVYLWLLRRDPWDDVRLPDEALQQAEFDYYGFERSVREEVERLKSNPEAFQAALDEVWARYREIEHLI